MDTRKELGNVLDAAVEEGEKAKKLKELLSIPDWQLGAVFRILPSLKRLFVDQQEPSSIEEAENLAFRVGLFAQLMDFTASGKMSREFLGSLVNAYHEQMKAASYLAEPFCRSYVVMGALALAVRAFRFRYYDLGVHAVRWSERLGKLSVAGANDTLLKAHPGLIPVAFMRSINPADPRLHQQFFGYTQALSRPSSAEKASVALAILAAACEKWPLADCYAFAPVPTWAADHTGQALWLEKRTWQEQQAELQRLQRLSPHFDVRFATLPELAFLDWSSRLAGVSPMEIAEFRCEHPTDVDKCVIYGHVDQYGAKITVEDGVSLRTDRKVMILFVLKTNKKSS